MSIPTSAKAGVLVILAVCTSLLTSALLADNGAPPDDGTRARGHMRRLPPDAKLRRPQSTLPVSAFKLLSYGVSVNDKTLDVAASVRIIEMRPGMTYLWTLTATDRSTSKPVVGQIYKTQRFSVQVGQPVTPTFEDLLRIGPGTYDVEVKLFQIPADSDITSLTHDQLRRQKGNALVGGFKTVTVK